MELHAIDYVLIAGLLLIVGFAVRCIIHNKKTGKCCSCGCTNNCMENCNVNKQYDRENLKQDK